MKKTLPLAATFAPAAPIAAASAVLVATVATTASLAGCAMDGIIDDSTLAASATSEDDALFAATAAPECPSAPEGWSLGLFWWKTTRQTERFVWTPDGTRVLGSELLFEEKKSWNPLNGTTDKRKMCHQLYLADPDGGHRQDLGGPAPSQVGELFAYPAAGYVVAQLFREGAWDFQRVGLDGGARTLATVSGGCEWGRVLPAPDGSRIAVVRTHQPGCQSGGVATTTDVAFLDATGAAIPGAGASVALAGFGQATWTPAGELVVTDGQAAATVSFAGVVAAAAVPRCTEPPTSSSEVDARGRVLGVSPSGEPQIVGTDASRAFGCQ
jgi:hypothetical protein